MQDYSTIVLKTLQETTKPLPLRSISSRIRAGDGFPDYIILRELRQLQKSGTVKYENGKWLAANPAIDHPRHVEILDLPLPKISSEAHSLIWPDTPAPRHRDAFIDKLPPTPGQRERWGYFRELLTYYRQCVRSEEGADASAFQNQLGKTFIYLHLTGLWQPRPGIRWQMDIPLGAYFSEFINTLPTAGEDSALVLGYPVNAYYRAQAVGPATCIIRPIFFYALEHEFTPNGLRVTISYPTPEINLGWLEYAFSRKADQQRNFLSACGFMRSLVTDDDLPGKERGEASPSIENLVTALTTFMRKRVKDSIQLAYIPGETIKEPFQSGIYNRAVLMLAKRTRYSRQLLKELTSIAAASDEELNQTALRHIFAVGPQEENEADFAPDERLVADIFQFNPSQRHAVASLLTRPVSVITGPPGTGKSQVVAGAAANARLRGQSVLISSRNHKAIDAVIHRLVDPDGNPMVIRANSKDDPNLRYTFSKAIRDILSGQENPQARENRSFILEDLRIRLEERGQEGIVARQVSAAAERLGDIEERLAYLAQEMPRDLSLFLDANSQAFPQALTKNVVQALRVVSKSLDSNEVGLQTSRAFPGLAFVTRYFLLRRRLWHIPGIPRLPLLPLKKARILLWRELKNLERATEYAEHRDLAVNLESEIRTFPPLEEITERIRRINDRIELILPQLLTLDMESRFGVPEGGDRTELSGLRSALNMVQTGLHRGRVDQAAKNTLRRHAPTVLSAFPVWAVTSLSVGSRLPFSPGMFDLALLDEASQSDIPSAIPILFRAKRVGVIGDPLQLNHTTKITPAKDTLLRRTLNLSHIDDFRFAYTQNSLYELCSGTRGAKSIFLDQTYRSAIEIADYSSRLFYGGKLQVATDPGGLNPPTGIDPGIHWTEIDGDLQSAGGGGCHCPQEVEALVRLTRNLLEERQFKGTLGIVTPFRQQANRIQDALYDGGANYQNLLNAQLNVDTAHGFQGDERDVILFSLCAGPGMPTGSHAFLRETGNLFNVAVSRARAVLHVVGNRKWAERCGIAHIERLASFRDAASVMPAHGPWSPHESPWEKVLFEALLAAGLNPLAQFPVRNRRLDMALIREGEHHLKVDIEVDGDCHRNPDGSRKQDDFWRDIQLQGLGWKVVRFWTYQLREDLPGCVGRIKNLWEKA